jgi:hypothetical protein
MPITARLSRRFYEAFGDDVVNELVEWFNQVDLTYRSELREQNELNFARFEAKLDQRLAELGADIRAEMHRVFTTKGDLQSFATKADLQAFATKAELRAELQAFATNADQTFATKADLRAELHALKAELIKWMFLFWAGTALGGLLLR